MISPELFLGIVKKGENEDDPTFALGTIPGTYSSGRPTITFDGESAASTNTYPYLSSYAPAAGHRVLLARVGHTWVVLGRVL